MLGHLSVGPTSTGVLLAAATPSLWDPFGRRRCRKRWGLFWISAAVNSHRQNHYAVLGISRSASSSDIKKAYRLLARKWHPDVSKDSRADELFKSIHLAYQVLSNEATRVQYDRALKSDEYTSASTRRNIYYEPEFVDEIRRQRWSKLKQKMQKDRYQNRYYDGGENFSFYTESDEESEDETSEEERGPFIEVLQSAFLSLVLMQTVGCQFSLLFSSLTAFLDGKLDAGYKLGYLIAWVLGGRGGVLLSMCLSFASWACGKNSSSVVTLVVVGMWVGSNLLSYAPLPQGALLALLYMSVKLHVDLN